MENRNTMTLDDVLNEFVGESDSPTLENLQKWADLYPQYRQDLVDFAATWAEQLALPPVPELGPEAEKRLFDRAVSNFLNAVFESDAQTAKQVASDVAIDSLTKQAQRVGMNAAEFANACKLDLVLITKINNRRILAESMPSSLLRHISTVISKSMTAVAEYLSLPPQAIMGRAFLARGKPVATGQQRFSEAVRDSSLTDAQKARWLDEVKREGKT